MTGGNKRFVRRRSRLPGIRLDATLLYLRNNYWTVLAGGAVAATRTARGAIKEGFSGKWQ
jgi:hypothetical protein